ncbi:MAG TPA: hypothetical protein VF383_04060 [Candidatus Dormibacteraeota bacterium]
MKSMRALVLAIGALALAAACGGIPGGQVSSGGYKLYEAASKGESQQLSVIDSRSHAVERNLPLGTPSANWSHLYSANGNVLLDLDPQTGKVLHQLPLPGNYKLPSATISGVPGGLSPNGHWLVLESFDATANGMATASHFVIVDTTYVSKPQRFDLSGYFQFDAINNGGGRVYLIQYVSNKAYYVRFFDVPAGSLDPTIVFDKSDGSAAMAGARLSGVASPDGQWLYSVYVRPDKSAFIHALSLENPIAFCIDLPGSGYNTNPDEFRWALAMNAAGTHLYAANGAIGVLADIGLDNGPNTQPRIVQIATGQASSIPVHDAQPNELGGGSAAMTPDGRTLVIGGKTGLVWIDAASLTAIDRQLSTWRVWSIAMSPDGKTLYAIDDAGMIAEVQVAGAHQATTFGGAEGQPLALIRVAGIPS